MQTHRSHLGFQSLSQALSCSLLQHSFADWPRACARSALYTARARQTVVIPGCLRSLWVAKTEKSTSLGEDRYQVGSGGRSPHRMLLGRGVTRLAAVDARPHRMLLGTGRYQVGSDGCSPHRMLLGTARCQVGSDGCSPHRMLLGTGRCQVGSDGCSPQRMLLGTGRGDTWWQQHFLPVQQAKSGFRLMQGRSDRAGRHH